VCARACTCSRYMYCAATQQQLASMEAGPHGRVKHAPTPHSVVLADGGAPAVLAFAPLSVVLADRGAPAVLACAPHSVVLADGGAPALHAPALLTVMRAFRA
jgi:hypothetical protein